MLQQLPKLFPGTVVSSSTPQNVEINHMDANKGRAVLALAEHLGLRRENTMAFGDGLNDLSMIRDAGIGVAMENACGEVLSAADYVTAHNDAHGVALAIEKFCFISKNEGR